MPRNKVVDNLMAAVRQRDGEVAGDEAAALKTAAAALNTDASGVLELTDPSGAASEPSVAVPETPPEPAPEPEARLPEPPATPAERAAPAAPAEPAEAGNPEVDRLQKAVEKERRETARLKAQLASLRELQPAPAAPLAPPPPPPPVAAPEPPKDPEPPKPGEEPDESLYQIEHDDWERKALRYDNWQTRQSLRGEIAQLQEKVTGFTQDSEQQRMASEFDRGVELQRQQYVRENPAFDQARSHLEQAVRRRMLRQRVPEHKLDELIHQAERQFFVVQMNQARVDMQSGLLPPDTNIAQYAFEMLVEEAKDAGWNGAPAAPAPAASQAGLTPAAQVADSAARASAGRSASTMRPRPVALPDDDKMTATKFMELTPLQRQSWKKGHPQWEMELGFIENEGNFITASR